MKYPLLLLSAGLMIGTPALAQYAPPPGHGWNHDEFWRGAPDSPRQRIQFLQERIDRGVADGSLDRREARAASNELGNIRRMDMRLHYDGGGRLNDRDRMMVQGRLDRLSQRLHWLRHNG